MDEKEQLRNDIRRNGGIVGALQMAGLGSMPGAFLRSPKGAVAGGLAGALGGYLLGRGPLGDSAIALAEGDKEMPPDGLLAVPAASALPYAALLHAEGWGPAVSAAPVAAGLGTALAGLGVRRAQKKLREATHAEKGEKTGAEAAWTALGLTKVAASVDELLGGLRRNKHRLLRMRAPQIPPQLNPLGQVSQKIRPGPMGLGAIKPTLKVMPEYVKQMLEELHGSVQNALPYQQGSRMENKVLWPKGNNADTFHGAIQLQNEFIPSWQRTVPQKLSPEGHKAFNALVGSHELRELSVPRDQLTPFASHRSPRLVAQDRNMLRTLTGPGAEEAKALFDQGRALNAENKTLDALLRHYFGKRAVKTYGHQVVGAPKIPGRMIDELSRRYKQDMATPESAQALQQALASLMQFGPAY